MLKMSKYLDMGNRRMFYDDLSQDNSSEESASIGYSSEESAEVSTIKATKKFL